MKMYPAHVGCWTFFLPTWRILQTSSIIIIHHLCFTLETHTPNTARDSFSFQWKFNSTSPENKNLYIPLRLLREYFILGTLCGVLERAKTERKQRWIGFRIIESARSSRRAYFFPTFYLSTNNIFLIEFPNFPPGLGKVDRKYFWPKWMSSKFQTFLFIHPHRVVTQFIFRS